MLTRLLVLAALFLVFDGSARADDGQEFIIGKLREQYTSLLNKVGDDAGKKAKVTSIYKRTVKIVYSKPGTGASSDAFAGLKEMQAAAQ